MSLGFPPINLVAFHSWEGATEAEAGGGGTGPAGAFPRGSQDRCLVGDVVGALGLRALLPPWEGAPVACSRGGAVSGGGPP